MKTISHEYRRLNEEMHEHRAFDGLDALEHTYEIVKLFEASSSRSILDYGCGRAALSEYLNLPIFNYDPCVPRFSAKPGVNDMIVCLDVLEHVEPEYIDTVLWHLWAHMGRCGYFHIALEPDTGKLLPDGRNPHLLLRPVEWWEEKLMWVFGLARHSDSPPGKVTFTVHPKSYDLDYVKEFVDRVTALG